MTVAIYSPEFGLRLRPLIEVFMMLPSASLTANHYMCQTLMTFAIYSFEFRGRSVPPASLSRPSASSTHRPLVCASPRPLMWELSSAVCLGETFVGKVDSSGSLRAEITGVTCL